MGTEREVYRGFGASPRRLRPSVEALSRGLIRTGRRPRINGPVDAYNAVSVRFGLPAAACDLDAVRGDIRVRMVRDADRLIPLGEPCTAQAPTGGEVVYADEAGILSRCWNHMDCDRRKVTEDSRNLLPLLESAQGDPADPLLGEATAALGEPLGGNTQEVTMHRLGVRYAETVPLSGTR